jgi:kynurenine--oxoglutarate transaminase/cysteine-S-conjugate beta-lyase/glutamine--phenylpyruvate transaminase
MASLSRCFFTQNSRLISKTNNYTTHAKNRVRFPSTLTYFLRPLSSSSTTTPIISQNKNRQDRSIFTSAAVMNSNANAATRQEQQVVESRFTLDKKYKGLENNVWVEFIDLNAKLSPLNLGQGFPDFMPAESVVKELAKTCAVDASPFLQQYTRSAGHPRLVKALAALYGRLINRTINPMTEVIVSIGAYGSLFNAVMSNVGVGEEVIIIEPFYDCYEPLVRLAGGTPVFIPLRPVNPSDNTSANWKLDMNEFAGLFNSKTKAIILNSPNNPLGKVFTREEMTGIANLCKKHDVLVISDEVYEWLVYDKNEHVRIASLDGMWDRTITIGSAGKTFSLTGWKLGWAYGPAHLIKNLQVAQQNCIYTCNTPLQEALAAGLEVEVKRLGTPDSFFVKMVKDLKERRDKMTRTVKECGMVPIIPEGGYFMLVDWTPLKSKTDLSKEPDEWADYRFVKWLAKAWGLLGIPPSAFYSRNNKPMAEDFIRFCFYKKTETLLKADEILKKWRDS